MSNCLIVCSQSIDHTPGYVAEVIQDAYSIAVDGGLAHFKRMKIKPDVWVGDADSVDRKVLARVKCRKVKLPKAKSYTDLEYALHVAGSAFLDGEWEGTVILIGAQGGRFDHDLGNLLVVQRWMQDIASAAGVENCPGVASYGEHGLWIATMNELEFHQGKRKPFSIVSFGPSPELTLLGAKYQLKKKPLAHASMGISNEGLGKTVRLRVHPPTGGSPMPSPVFVFFPEG